MSSRSRSTTRKSTKRSRASTRSTSRRPRASSSVVGRRTDARAAPSVGLGTSATTVLRTSFFYNASAAAGTGIWTGYLKPGSCFDPTGDLSAIQPQMFDQFAAMYNRYKVNNCHVRIKIHGGFAAAATYAWVGAGYPAIDPTAVATYQAAASQQYAKTTSGGFQLLNAAGCGTEGKMLDFKLKHDSIIGAKSDTWDIGALVTADPTALQFMVLPMFLQGSGAGAHVWILEIDMFQNVTFSQKKNTVDA